MSKSTVQVRAEPVTPRVRELREILGRRRKVYADEQLAVHISALDVEGSVRLSQRFCPTACCIRRDDPELVDVAIRRSRAWLVYGPDDPKKGYYVIYFVTASLRDQIARFDKIGEFVPGTYRLTPLKPSSRVPKTYRAPSTGRGKRQSAVRTIPLSGVSLLRNAH